MRVQKGKYYVLDYWDRDEKRHIQEYIGSDKAKAYHRLIEVLEDKIAYYQKRQDEAKAELEGLK